MRIKDSSLYLQYAYAISEKLNLIKAATRDELQEYFEEIRQEYMDDLELTLDEIFDDYCDENNLEWVEED